MHKIFVFILLVFSLICFSGSHLGNTLPIEEAAKKWGEKPFNIKKFKEGSIKDRSSMVVDMIKSKIYLGKDSDIIYQELGSGSGFFISDHIPTYLLERGGKRENPTWQLVFDIDSKGKIIGLYIQENGSELDAGLFKTFLQSLKKAANEKLSK